MTFSRIPPVVANTIRRASAPALQESLRGSSGRASSHGAQAPDGVPSPRSGTAAADASLVPRRSLSVLADGGATGSITASNGRSAPATPLGSGRPISTVATPTVTDPKGRVRDPGHVQLQSSPAEQAQYGVGPVLGHSPQTSQRPGSRTNEHETGTFPDGRPFDIMAVRSPALPAGQDKVRTDAPIRHDHGHMTPEQAERFKSYEGQPVSPEYQTVRDNCVTGYDQMFSGIMDRPPRNPPVGTRPQDIADANKNVRTDGSDLKRK